MIEAISLVVEEFQAELGSDDEPALRHPVLSSVHEITRGHWSIVGHDETLIERFAEPEWFNPAPSPVPGVDLGEHGAAESLDRSGLRLLSAEEAHEAGLDRDDFRQFHLPEHLAKWLLERL